MSPHPGDLFEGCFGRTSRSGLFLRSARCSTPHTTGEPLSKPVPLAGAVLADPEYTHGAGQKIGGFRTFLGVPLLREGSPIGAIALGRNSVRPFTDKQIDLVATFADQAVIAIENVRLFEEVQKRTEDLSVLLQQQTATADVLKVMVAARPSICRPCSIRS